MRRPKRLTAAFVKRVQEPGRYGDGRGGFGLTLIVQPSTSGGVTKCWAQRVRIGGRPNNYGLGPYPRVGLQAAREQAAKNYFAIREGHAPFVRRSAVPTFRQAAASTIAELAPTWKTDGRTEDMWNNTLERFVWPRLGDMPVSAITPKLLHNLLAPIWTEKPATGRKLVQRISAVMKWVQVQGHRNDDPTAALRPPKNGHTEHYEAVPHSELRDVIRTVDGCEYWRGAKLALTFLIHTAARSAEVTGAKWSEIDLQACTWTIPANRTKTKRAHVVPLTNGARLALVSARGLHPELVFPSQTGRVMNGMILRRVLKAANVDATVHGFRSSFRDWCGDTGQPREVAEACLAHTVGNATEAAYARSDLFKRRQVLMGAWSDYLGL